MAASLRFRIRLGLLLAILVSCLPVATRAEDAGTLTRLDSARSGVTIPLFLHATDGAKATLLLLPGGAGGIGKIGESGWPDGGNFLVRSAALFAASGFNVAIMARPSDLNDMDYGFRTGAEHVDDVRRGLQALKGRFGAPIWLVGTSRGTVSAAAAGIALRDEGLIDGIVLTSSVTFLKKRSGAVPTQALDRIEVPVLVMHHVNDACGVCRPYEAGNIVSGLKNAPVKKLIMASGGSGADGDPCEPFHYHGFIGMEREAVALIADWIKHPSN